MKALFLLVSLLLLISCNDIKRKDREFYRELKSPILIDEINKYMIRNNHKAKNNEVMYLQIDTLSDNEVTALISTSIYLSEIKKVMPSYFTKVDGEIVLIHSKKKYLYKDSISRWEFFRKLTNSNLKNDIGSNGETIYGFAPDSFDPEVRVVKIVNNKKISSYIMTY